MYMDLININVYVYRLHDYFKQQQRSFVNQAIGNSDLCSIHYLVQFTFCFNHNVHYVILTCS